MISTERGWKNKGISIRISGIFAEAFTSEAPYTRNYGNSGSPLSDKTRVKNSDNPFQGNTDNNNPPPENGQFSASRYKGGPSPFENFEYQDPAIVAKNIEHNLPRRANKSYDKHHSCFGLPKNRNKANLEKFEGCTDDLAQSAEEVFKGSYRYERPAYIYEKEIDGKLTAVIVDAITNEYISTFNPTTSQQENLESTGNLGLDTRPSMELRLRGPKGQNYL